MSSSIVYPVKTLSLGSTPISVFSDLFNRNSIGSNYELDGSGYTLSFPGSSYMNISGLGGAGNFIQENSYTAAQYFTVKVRYRNNIISSTSAGLNIGIMSQHPLGSSVPVYFNFNQNTGNANLGKITITAINGGNYSATSIASMPQPSVGDILEMTLQRINEQYVCTVINETSGTTIQYITFGSATGNPFFTNNTGRPFIGFLGGNIDILEFDYQLNEYLSPLVLLVGDSITCGGEVTNYAYGYPNQLYGEFRFVVNLSGDADYSAVILQRLPEAILLKPINAYLMFGGNDIAFGVSLQILQQNYTAFVEGLQSIGTNVYHLLSTPRNSTNVTAFNDWIKTTWPNTFIDTYTTLWNRTEGSTGLSSTYDSGDGLHPNNLGNLVLATTIQSSGKIPNL